MWWKQHKWKVIIPLLIVVVLVGTFWYGGNAPGARGLDVLTNTPPQSVTENHTQDMVDQTQIPQIDQENATTMEPGETEQEPDAEQPSEPPSSKQPEPKPEQTSEPPASKQPEMVIDPETGKDQYLTDPVPEGKPLPVEPQDVTIGTTAHSCTISISCATILDNLDLCDPEKKELVPENGWILEPMTVTFYEGESVFNVLQRTCKQQKIHMEFEDTPMYNSAYIEGIHNLYEFDVGELSGWMYSVNDWFPNYGCSRYQLRDGDIVEWVYTCDLGADVGRGFTENRGAN